MTDTAEKLAEALAQIVLIEADSTTIAADKIRGAARIARAALDANRADRAKGAVTDEMVERACRALCAANHWNPDEPVKYSGSKRTVHNRDGSVCTQWMMHQSNARSILESLPMLGVPDGWQLVPREPTGAMLASTMGIVRNCALASEAWRKMLAAAPKPEVSE